MRKGSGSRSKSVLRQWLRALQPPLSPKLNWKLVPVLPLHGCRGPLRCLVFELVPGVLQPPWAGRAGLTSGDGQVVPLSRGASVATVRHLGAPWPPCRLNPQPDNPPRLLRSVSPSLLSLTGR